MYGVVILIKHAVLVGLGNYIFKRIVLILSLINPELSFSGVVRTDSSRSDRESVFSVLPKMQGCLPLEIYREDLMLAISFNISQNDTRDQPSSFQLTEHYDLRMRLQGRKNYWDISLKSDLGYEYFLDSIWELRDDDLNISAFRLCSSEAKLKYTYSIQLNTILLPEHKMIYAENDSYARLRSGNFFNPGDIQLAYGLSWRFWEYSLINVSLATIKFQGAPIYRQPDSLNIFGYYDRKLSLDYGFSFSSRISHQISKRLKWNNQCRFFFNSLEHKSIRLDVYNQLSYSIINWLNLSILSRLNYFPMIQEKVQVIQEFRLGFDWNLGSGK